ncbi:MAG: response regulator, partial [Candidatus Aureabacteria bacterium]|nr:response regulator [Candidatus Auribacterota bacterium]
NLAVNARDAMQNGGKLTIETANIHLNEAYCRDHLGFTPGYYVLLGVSDDGAGMDRETLEYIFEPFFTTKETGKGTGLGLATVYGIVKQHGGNVYVDSEEGIGTTFKIYLPRISGAVDAAAHKGREDKLTGGSESVLLVEDDRSILDITSRALRSQGYQVITAENGKHALEVAKTHNGRIAILVTDVIMPIMGGKELADMLVATNKGMKIIFVSGYPDTSVVSQRIVKEGLCFLQKPYTVQSLLEKVRAVLDGTELSD